MNSHNLLLTVTLAILLTGAGYERPAQARPVLSPVAASPAADSRQSSGKVLETMNAGGYTYVHVDTGTDKMWVAAPKFEVKVGDTVVVPEGLAMTNFRSNTTGRTFEVLHLVGSVEVEGRANRANPIPRSNGGSGAKDEPAPVDLSGIAKVDGGRTVGELFEKKATLVGTPVTVRGKVIKFTAAVMGKNWIHVQDGTGAAAANDLVVATDGVASIGDTILVSGILGADRDLGFGYKYEVIIEDAQIKIE